VLSLRVLEPNESEARRVEGDVGSWGGGLPLRTSLGGQWSAVTQLPQQGLKTRLE